jgi:hypothetical protein
MNNEEFNLSVLELEIGLCYTSPFNKPFNLIDKEQGFWAFTITHVPVQKEYIELTMLTSNGIQKMCFCLTEPRRFKCLA